MSKFKGNINVSYEELIYAFSNALSLIDIRLFDHHKQVA